MHACEIIRKTTNPDGTSNSPMRNAEAQVTLGVVAARSGELDAALSYGRTALAIDRRSQPSLLMIGTELDAVLQEWYERRPGAIGFHNELCYYVPRCCLTAAELTERHVFKLSSLMTWVSDASREVSGTSVSRVAAST
jgi:hypothetical protein